MYRIPNQRDVRDVDAAAARDEADRITAIIRERESIRHLHAVDRADARLAEIAATRRAVTLRLQAEMASSEHNGTVLDVEI